MHPLSVPPSFFTRETRESRILMRVCGLPSCEKRTFSNSGNSGKLGKSGGHWGLLENHTPSETGAAPPNIRAESLPLPPPRGANFCDCMAQAGVFNVVACFVLRRDSCHLYKKPRTIRSGKAKTPHNANTRLIIIETDGGAMFHGDLWPLRLKFTPKQAKTAPENGVLTRFPTFTHKTGRGTLRFPTSKNNCA